MENKNNVIIVFANQKGGVGKSTLCLLLANYLVYWKKNVCVIDTDLQQSASLQRQIDEQQFGTEPRMPSSRSPSRTLRRCSS